MQREHSIPIITGSFLAILIGTITPCASDGTSPTITVIYPLARTNTKDMDVTICGSGSSSPQVELTLTHYEAGSTRKNIFPTGMGSRKPSSKSKIKAPGVSTGQ